MNPELEMMFEIWSGPDYHFEIGPDRDGLGMIEIRYYDGDSSKSTHRMSFSKKEVALVVKALTRLLEEDPVVK